MQLFFYAKDEIYNNGLVHVFIYLKEKNEESYSKSEDRIEIKNENYTVILMPEKLKIECKKEEFLRLFRELLDTFEERPQFTNNSKYWYDTKTKSIIWSNNINYSDTNKIKSLLRRKLSNEEMKSVKAEIEIEKNLIGTQNISQKEKKERMRSLKELIKKDRVYCLITPEELYSNIFEGRDFSKEDTCPICGNYTYMVTIKGKYERLNTSKHFNMSSHGKFFEFNRDSDLNNLCSFCYLFYFAGILDADLIKIKRYYGTFNDNLINQYYLTLLCKEISNYYGLKNNKQGYHFDKYSDIKHEKEHEKFYLSDGVYEISIFIAYVIYNYFKRENRRDAKIENTQLVLFTKKNTKDIPDYFIFNEFEYAFKLFDACYNHKESNQSIKNLFSRFFNCLYLKKDKTPYRNLISKQILDKALFFENIKNVLYSKLKNSESGIIYLPEFIKVYLEVIKMELNYLDTARKTGESIALFCHRVEEIERLQKFLEPIYRLREISTKSKFLENLRNLQFTATKNSEMVFSNELMDQIQKTLIDIDERDFKDFLNLIAIYAVQKYLSIAYAKKKQGGN